MGATRPAGKMQLLFSGVSINSFYVGSLGAFPWLGCGIVFCRNVENIILFARFLLRSLVMSMSLSIKALVRFLCMPYRLWLKNYFKKVLE